jgi:hypothetical protein
MLAFSMEMHLAVERQPPEIVTPTPTIEDVHGEGMV